ncbi:HET-domain-containing protein [Parathielavia appendiculata]|uniref:HET-domain-containing protein n=1 Tax=Parathielavia appendiculata TaxID=2587402 RepID=A0AAN6TPZ0_9PEZI|nr:HET-domain-containing protein [Parathielavia appendiculata]
MASIAPGQYPYRPLSQQKDEPEIRLLSITYPPAGSSSSSPQQLKPPINDDHTCLLTLTHHRLPLTPPSTYTTEPPNPPSFAALSYVWGLPTPGQDPPQIQIDGYAVPVTANLHGALSRLQRQRFAGHLWIDALCINQGDATEKSAQVALMGRIYALAERVVVWLGSTREEERAGCGALRDVGELGALFREQVLGVPQGLAGAWEGGRVEGFVKTVVQFAVTASTEKQQRVGFDFEAIWRLLRERPWWRRVWIIQEVVLARQAVVLCGENPELPGASVPWEDVRDCLRLFEWMVLYPNTGPEHTRLYALLGDIYPNVSHLALASDGYRRSLENPYTGLPVLDIMMWTSFGTSTGASILATDPRDRIYGLLGMVREEDRRRIPIDYSPDMTLGKVLFAVGKALLEDYGPDMLSFCHRTLLSPAGLPSWAPDWTAPRLMPLIGGVFFGNEKDARGRGDASKGASWRDWATKCQIRHAAYENPVVSLQGVVVGQVGSLGREFKTAPDSPSYLDNCRDWLVEVEEMAKMRNARGTAVLDEIWRVPMADFGLGARADVEGAARFRHGFDVLMGRIPPPCSEVKSGATTSWVSAESWDYRRVWKIYERRAFVDDVGRPGLGPKDAAVGDQIVVFAGAHVPFIVRQELASQHRYRVLGPAYVYEMMDGEALTGGVSFRVMDII